MKILPGNTVGIDLGTTFSSIAQINAEGEPIALDNTEGKTITPSVVLLGEDGKEITPIMGSYGIGVERILTCAVELFHDKDGMMLPAEIAPFTVVITPVNFADQAQREAAIKIYEECQSAGIDALLDDRDERPGVKFKDADLIGLPYRITVGKKLSEGKVEFIERLTKKSTDVAVDEIVGMLKTRLA